MSLNKTKIDWVNPKEGWKLEETWNPVVGCKTDCWYCYARRMNDRFKWIPDWNDPQFFPERLSDNFDKLKPGSVIFIGSMCDLFGPWIPDIWINRILNIVDGHKEHKFMFLTKYPYNYYRYQLPSNCWIGTTISRNSDITKVENLRLMGGVNKKFVSVEPLMGYCDKINFSGIDLVIVGAMTGRDAIIPTKEFIESIKHDNIHYKQNIKKYL